MHQLSSGSDKLLMQICEYYIKTGQNRFSSTVISLDINKSYINELHNLGYIIAVNNIIDSIELTDRTIKFANQMK